MNAVSLHLNSTIAPLKARIEALEAENAYLRSELGLTLDAARVAALKRAYPRLRPSGINILIALYNAPGRTLTRMQLDDVVPHHDHAKDRDLNLISVQMNNARKVIGADAVRCVWGRGYTLTDVGAAIVEQALSAMPEAA